MPTSTDADLLSTGADGTAYRLLIPERVRAVAGPGRRERLEVSSEALRLMSVPKRAQL